MPRLAKRRGGSESDPARGLDAGVNAVIAAWDSVAAVRSLVVMVCPQEHQMEERIDTLVDLRAAVSCGYARRFSAVVVRSAGVFRSRRE